MAATPPGSATVELSEDELDELLGERGHGVLSLADGGRAYGVPMSFGYDGDRLFLEFVRFGEDSEKSRFRESTVEACLTTYTVETRFAWQSLVVRGPLAAVGADEADYAASVLDEYAWKPRLDSGGEDLASVSLLELEIEAITGRRRTGLSG